MQDNLAAGHLRPVNVYDSKHGWLVGSKRSMRINLGRQYSTRAATSLPAVIESICFDVSLSGFFCVGCIPPKLHSGGDHGRLIDASS